MNNLINVVKFPTRITRHTKSLIDVVIVDNTKDDKLIEILDMGYSDHLAQLFCMKSKKIPKGPLRIHTRHFTDNKVEEFKYLIQKETWNEVFECKEPNNSFKQFMNTLTYYFNTAFPIKVKLEKNSIANKWITKGLIISRDKLRLLCNIKRTTSLSIEDSEYIQNYQRIFRKVVIEGKKKEADRYVLSSKNKNKSLWKLINREIGKTQKTCDIINIRDKIITNLQIVSDQFNTFL